ncbi:MAG: carbonic anhydrase [Clostridiaceae bacterium]
MNKKFVTALNCIDGRTQIPVTNWLKENFNIAYVDLITEPGMNKVLSQGSICETERIKEKVIISITAHNSNLIAIVGHFDCAANPVDKYKHFSDIVKSSYVVSSWNLNVRIIGLWVDEFWNVSQVNL